MQEFFRERFVPDTSSPELFIETELWEYVIVKFIMRRLVGICCRQIYHENNIINIQLTQRNSHRMTETDPFTFLTNMTSRNTNPLSTN